MFNKKFLEEYPLYKKFPFEVSYYDDELTDIPTPAINMLCGECESIQTFNVKNYYWELHAQNEVIARSIDIWGKTVRAKYVCSSCNSYEYLFFLQFIQTGKSEEDDNKYKGFVWKIGQTPRWEIEVNIKLENLLGKHSSYYKKGLANESEGYGIGAYAYYRRIVDDVIDELLNNILDLVKEDLDKEQYKEALKKVKESKVAEDKINIVKDLLPTSLRPDGINPLKTLHSLLSKGLHQMSEEDCLTAAESIREILVYLVNQVSKQKEDAIRFTSHMKKLLSKK